MKRLFPFLVLIATLFSGCSISERKLVTIGIDPSFYPTVLGGQADNAYGFTVDLLQAICKIENLNLRFEQAGSENLMSGLQRGYFQAITSSLKPQSTVSETFVLSNLYLKTGPVLVVPYDSKLTNLSQFKSKIVGTVANSDAYYMVQKYPFIIISTYSSPAFLLEALVYNDLDGALLNILEARSFVKNLYYKVVKIASSPLNEDGLRLIALKGQDSFIIDKFNDGLEECKKRGIYQNLIQKWGLN